MLTAIRNWVVRTMMKAKGETGIVKTLPKKEIVEINTQITAERLMQNGVDPRSLKNADQVENAIIAIENRKNVQTGFTTKKSADVFDLEGKKIDTSKGIMGGKQIDDLPPGDPDLPPPGSRGGDEDIAAPFQSAEESIKDMIEAENKKAIEGLKQKMKKEQARSKRISGTLRRDNQLRGQTEEIGKPKLDEDEYEYYRELLDDEENIIVQGDETREQLEAMVKEAKDEMAYMKRLYDKGALDPPEDMAQGGRAGFKGGLGPKFLNFLKSLKKEKPFSVKEFLDKRKFIGADKIENKIQMMKNKKVLEEARKEFKKNPPFKFPEPGSKEYDEALARVQRALIEDRKLNAEGGRAGFSDGSKGLLDLLDIQASGSKSGKQQIDKAPEGFTIDDESYNFILNADIPINEKINLLTTYGRGKGRTRIEKDDQELFLDEGGFRTREIGLDINPDAEKGFSGNIMYNPDTENTKLRIGYKYADGGRIGYKLGSFNKLGGFKTIFNFLNENNPVQAYKKYLQSVKTRAQENPKALAPELAAIASGGIFVNRRMQDILKNMKEKDMENNLENFKEELNKDPFYQKYPDIKDKVLENYTEKMFGEKRADGGRIGYFMGSANPRGLGLLRQLLNFFGKKSDVIKNPSDVLKVINPKAFNKMLEDAKGKVIPKEGIMATDKVKDYQTQMAKDRIEMVKDMMERGKRMKGADDKILAYKNDVKERFMKDLQMSEADAEIAADRMATLAMDVTKMEKTPTITDEGLLQLENVLKNLETGGKKKRELNATGGRIGFKDGMSRRTFLKLLGGLASIPIIGKIVKPIKLTTGVKKVPIIKTDNVPGKPEWFDQLVNKVIIEGDDVTKKFATGERQSIHQKTLDDGSVVRVTEDVDDGAVRVEYESEANTFGDTVQLQYKKPLPDEGDPRPVGEFTTAESGPVGRVDGPDDFDIDVDEVGGTSIRDLDSDVSKLKEYATGKKLTMKEIVEAKKRKDKAKSITEDPEAQSDAVIRRQGDYDPSDYDDFASGGIARMLGE